jgi:S-adenosylmethionine:tRNA ribosyltransferase-isomerase
MHELRLRSLRPRRHYYVVEAGLAVEGSGSRNVVPSLGPIKEAAGPVELLEPGRERDDVRLLVTSGEAAITHARFVDFHRFLGRGDVVVVNDSATIPAAVAANADGRELRLHISSAVSGTPRRLVELRIPDGIGSAPYVSATSNDLVQLPGGARARLVAPLLRSGKQPRLWEAELTLPDTLHAYLTSYGEPIRYGYVSRAWSLDAYQTIFARVAGSSEMPSATRPFSWRLVRRMRDQGVSVVPLTLHAGVASLESDEEPGPEPFRISPTTARAINDARSSGRRVIAAGTTVIRALETAIRRDGRVEATEGVTSLVIEPSHQIRSVSGLLTGFHEPEASHLKILQAVAGDAAVARSYRSAVDEGYTWHEFGDVHLLMTPDA